MSTDTASNSGTASTAARHDVAYPACRTDSGGFIDATSAAEEPHPPVPVKQESRHHSFPETRSRQSSVLVLRLRLAQTRFGGRSCTRAPQVDSLANVHFNRATVMFRGGELGQLAVAEDKPEPSCHDADAHGRVSCFKSLQRGNCDSHALGPGFQGFFAAQTRYGSVGP